jgi:hypothetical protein
MDRNMITVKELIVRVVTGDPSKDPYGQGFSAIWAEAVVNDRSGIELLAEAKERHVFVTVRCAMLDVTGPITKGEVDGQSYKFVLAVEEMTCRNPKDAGVEVTRQGRGPG